MVWCLLFRISKVVSISSTEVPINAQSCRKILLWNELLKGSPWQLQMQYFVVNAYNNAAVMTFDCSLFHLYKQIGSFCRFLKDSLLTRLFHTRYYIFRESSVEVRNQTQNLLVLRHSGQISNTNATTAKSASQISILY